MLSNRSKASSRTAWATGARWTTPTTPTTTSKGAHARHIGPRTPFCRFLHTWSKVVPAVQGRSTLRHSSSRFTFTFTHSRRPASGPMYHVLLCLLCCLELEVHACIEA